MEDLLAYFQSLARQGALSHAYILAGHNQAGKEALITGLAQTLARMDQDPVESDGTASVCRRIEARQTADLIDIYPEGRFIRVDQVRDLSQWLVRTPVELPFKLASLHQADRMHPAAANALLKSLEEPVANVYIFLLVPSSDSLLPTIVSRAQVIQVPDRRPVDLAEDLVQRGLDPAHSQVLSQLGSADLEVLLADYDPEMTSRWLGALKDFYASLYRGQPQALVQVQSTLQGFFKSHGRPLALLGLDYLMGLNSQMIGYRYQLAGQLALDFEGDFLQDLAQAQGPLEERVLFDLQEALVTSKEYILANVPSQLAYEYLAIHRLLQS